MLVVSNSWRRNSSASFLRERGLSGDANGKSYAAANFAGLRVTKREHVRANGAEPIVNDMVSVLSSAWDNGHLGFHQTEAKKSPADEMIEVGATNRVGAFGNHGALPCTETIE
jgi:hypothetical protein